MLGEADLVRGRLEPGERMQSMMALDARARPGRACPRSRRRRRHASQDRVARRDRGSPSTRACHQQTRLHSRASIRAATSSTPSRASTRRRCEARGGRTHVRRWPARHHYFGGVSLVSRSGAAGTRGGTARQPLFVNAGGAVSIQPRSRTRATRVLSNGSARARLGVDAPHSRQRTLSTTVS
jgi:hypothetical protein